MKDLRENLLNEYISEEDTDKESSLEKKHQHHNHHKEKCNHTHHHEEESEHHKKSDFTINEYTYKKHKSALSKPSHKLSKSNCSPSPKRSIISRDHSKLHNLENYIVHDKTHIPIKKNKGII